MTRRSKNPPPADKQVRAFVDRFSVFRNAVFLTGWCFSEGEPIDRLEIRPAGYPASGQSLRFKPVWLPSADVEAAYGPLAGFCRFDQMIALGINGGSACGGTLLAVLGSGAVEPLCTLGAFRPSAASDLADEFFAMLHHLPSPRILEVGARARSGITRRDQLPAGAEYVGCDIVPGENVDIVCDAHALSKSLPHGHYNAVMAISVLEHLIMPWKFVIELNKVLQIGAIGFFATHQCWPIHDAPHDFWRFSDHAWHGLFNPPTGFEIIKAAMGEPAYVVAADCHQVTNFGPNPAAFLASNVLIRKTAETTLTWNVDLSGLTKGHYPA